MNICIGLSDMTKKILVIGLTERMGGVETFIYNTTRFSNKEIYEYDFKAKIFTLIQDRKVQ